MKFSTSAAPHSVAPLSVQRMMLLVLVALVPAMIAHIVWFGWGLAINMLLGTLSALCAEAIALKLRGKPIGPFITDGSAILTAVLLALALPPLAPWWITVSGAAFAMLVAKHLYGGLGYNVFNPAMAGYAALLVSFPVQMTRWILPTGLAPVDLTFTQTLYVIATEQLPNELTWDALSGATPLASVRAGLLLRSTMEEIHTQPIFSSIAGVGWEWVALMALLGGLGLLTLRVIRWQIPMAMLGSIFFCALIMHAIDPGNFAGPLFHLFSGATMLGAFFIATDPVSAATSDRGRLIYGAGIGALAYGIRAWGGYPDGVAFAVLLMNAAVPLIDRYTVPKIYGHSQ
jgi:Na+-translocating ferredoxin:NAD+ oxidoreductase subunit D